MIRLVSEMPRARDSVEKHPVAYGNVNEVGSFGRVQAALLVHLGRIVR